ncbi:MAG: class II aldolase/adducin family protein [Candidatus Woesearchaeota archaeon]
MLKDIISVLRESYKRRWITPRDGNISYKQLNSSKFFITPSGLRKQELNESDFIQIEIIKDGWKQLNNFNLKPSGEIELHYELLKSVNKNICVVHLHPTYSVAAMYKGIDLSSLSISFPELSRYTKIAKNTEISPPLSKKLAFQCKTNLLFDNKMNDFSNNIVGIPNHGVVSIGENVHDAFEHIERLEHISSIVLLSQN